MKSFLEWALPGVARRRAENRRAAAAADAQAANLRLLEVQLKARSHFKAAEGNRLTNHYPAWDGDLNSWTPTQLKLLRNKSRWLAMNNEYAKSALGILSNYVVGTGMLPQAAVRRAVKHGDEIEMEDMDGWNDFADDLWEEWSESIDIGCGELDPRGFLELQTMTLRRLFIDGEVFIRVVNPKDWPVVPLACEMLLPEWLNEYISKDPDTGNMIDHGIELDSHGRRVAYHFSKAKGNGAAKFPSDIRLKANEVIHIFKRESPRQLRGVPELAAVMDRVFSLGEYTDFELISAKIAACFGAFITRPAGDSGNVLTNKEGRPQVTDSDGNVVTTVEPGIIANLPEGYGVSFAQPQKPGATFDMFATHNLRAIGAGIGDGLSYEALTRDTSRSTFAGGRLSQIMDYQTFRGLQQFMEKRLGKPIRRLWLEAAVSSGAIEAPGYFESGAMRRFWERCDFIHSGWSWGINPLQEVNAARESMRAGITTLADECSYLGRNWKQQLRMQRKINRVAQRYGVQLSGNPADDGTAGAKPAAGDGDNPDPDKESEE